MSPTAPSRATAQMTMAAEYTLPMAQQPLRIQPLQTILQATGVGLFKSADQLQLPLLGFQLFQVTPPMEVLLIIMGGQFKLARALSRSTEASLPIRQREWIVKKLVLLQPSSQTHWWRTTLIVQGPSLTRPPAWARWPVTAARLCPWRSLNPAWPLMWLIP